MCSICFVLVVVFVVKGEISMFVFVVEKEFFVEIVGHISVALF